jgi:hypothetical protein
MNEAAEGEGRVHFAGIRVLIAGVLDAIRCIAAPTGHRRGR